MAEDQTTDQSNQYKYLNIVDRVGDMPGAKRASNTIEVVVVDQIDADIVNDGSRTLGVVNIDASQIPLDVNQQGTVTVQEDTALDVSGETVTIQEGTPLDVSGAIVTVQEDAAMDVSAATVDVQEDTPLDVSGATITADVSDRTGRDLGKARLMDESGTLIGESNPQHVVNPSYTNISTGQETVATAGTAEQFNGGTSLPVPQGGIIRITNLPDNTDTVYVGDSSVSSSNGFPLGSTATTPIDLHVNDVNTLWVDAASDGEGVAWIIEE